jgi:hypothetical protein
MAAIDETTKIGQLEHRLMVAEANVRMLHDHLKPLLEEKGAAVPALMRSPHGSK